MASRIKVFWSSEARLKHQEIREYIALDNPDAAREWATETKEAIQRLAEMPMIGRVVPEFRRVELREIIHGRHYRIVYRILSDEIEIITIVHTAQNLENMME